jgi:hypothetical protein
MHVCVCVCVCVCVPNFDTVCSAEMDTPASVAVLAHLQCRTDLHTEATGPINTKHV